MSVTETLKTCWIPASQARPTEDATWFLALDGSGWRGYSDGPVADPRWEILVPLLALPGANAEAHANHHYVVETDVPPDAESDFNAWYDQEHMPGLARVAGTVRAMRFRRARGHPVYMACYDLVSPDVLGCEAWLAVRGTPWSSRVRPQFFNTRRTMHRLDQTPTP
jgi:hypothetical protein